MFLSLLAGAIFSVSVTDGGFDPSTIEVKEGDTVVFRSLGQNPHWPASNIHPSHEIYPELDPKRPIPSGENWEFTFDKPGKWRMHDHLFPTSSGVIIVGEVKGASEIREGFLDRFFSFLRDLFQKFRSLLPLAKTEEVNPEAIFSSDKDLFAHVKKFGPSATIKKLNDQAALYGSCHDPAHKAGRFAYEIFKEKAFKECREECHSGCYHGATEAFFKEHGTANLQQNLEVLCSSQLNPFFSHQCVHGIGHGLMAWTNYEIFEALESCNLLSERQDSCWTGVFMENIVGGLSGRDGHSTKYLSEDPSYPCNVVEEKYKWSCYFLQTSRMVQLFHGDFSKVADACNSAPEPYHSSCFQSMGRDVGGSHRGDPQGAIAACGSAPAGEFRVNCLTGAVQDSFWDVRGQDTAISFCNLLVDEAEKKACYKTIFGRAVDLLTSQKDREGFCEKIEDQYRGMCYHN